MTLTKKDLQEVRKIVEIVVEVELEEKLEEKLEQKFDEKLKYLPTKEEFYSKMDEVMGELKTIREEQQLLSSKLPEVTDRVEQLEDIHPNYSHS